jgi:hypothetical protein
MQVSRRSLRRLLFQIEMDERQITSESLELALSSVVSENRFRLIIREGLLCGSNVVTSPTFVHYCLGRFPNSEWFVRYVTFLFATFWESNSDVYEVFLHMLSIKSFTMTTQLLLFQYVFCFMQASENSPIIERHLNKYRLKMSEFFSIHREFWSTQSESSAKDLYADLVRELCETRSLLRSLSILFPFSRVFCVRDRYLNLP